MSHKMQAGIDRMATTEIDSIWHRRETVANGILVQFDKTLDAEGDFLRMASHVQPTGHDNNVLRSIGIQTVEGTAIETHKANLSPTGRVLGVVGIESEFISNEVLMREWILELVRAGGEVQTLGTFDEGRNFFASIKPAPDFYVDGDHSKTRSYLNIVNNHAGTGALRAMLNLFRVQCANTDAVMCSQHDKMAEEDRAKNAWVSIQHNKNATERMKDALAYIVDGRARVETQRQLLNKLAAKVIPASEVDAFIKSYISTPDGATSRTKNSRSKQQQLFVNTLTDTEDLGNHAMGNNGQISAYGLLQSVTRYEDHVSPVRTAKEQSVGNRRAFRAFLAERQVEKATAKERIVQLANL